jgi:hypothetical protein
MVIQVSMSVKMKGARLDSRKHAVSFAAVLDAVSHSALRRLNGRQETGCSPDTRHLSRPVHRAIEARREVRRGTVSPGKWHRHGIRREQISPRYEVRAALNNVIHASLAADLELKAIAGYQRFNKLRP